MPVVVSSARTPTGLTRSGASGTVALTGPGTTNSETTAPPQAMAASTDLLLRNDILTASLRSLQPAGGGVQAGRAADRHQRQTVRRSARSPSSQWPPEESLQTPAHHGLSPQTHS